MNRYPLWKYLLIGTVLLAGFLYALPNIYGQDPAVQVSRSAQAELPPGVEEQVRALLEREGIAIERARREENSLLFSLTSDEDQARAREILSEELGRDYTVAMNLIPAAPAWLRAIGGRPMNLGLDLRGGVHFLLEVDMESALQQNLEQEMSDMRRYLREQRIRYRGINRDDSRIVVAFDDDTVLDEAERRLQRRYDDLSFERSTVGERPAIVARLTEGAIEAERAAALEQNVTTLRNRVDELGVAEPIVQRQGDERIVVQLPGVQDTTRAKEILGATATLEFRLVHGSRGDWLDAERTGQVPFDALLYERRGGGPVLLKRDVIVTGDQINDAASGFDSRTGQPNVSIRLNNRGASSMQDVTADNVGNDMAVVFIENIVETRRENGELVRDRMRVEEVINIATIRDVLSHRFQITGLGSSAEARNLALLLRAGALRAPVEIIEERTVGPSLGRDNIEQGFLSVVGGLVLVLVFMAFYYRVFGLVANLALIVNLAVVVAVLSALQATLTLPGIAGIVLTVGMAVDANVIIFERIREELRNGNSIQASIHAGYDRALSTIADANITTLIAAVVLFAFGTGPVKGFAVTLSIGIVTSMFTAIMGTRAVVNAIYGGRRLKSLPI